MSEQDMENLDKKEEFDDDHISTETLHDIREGNQTHPNIDKREVRLKIRDCIKQKKWERNQILQNWSIPAKSPIQ